MLEKPNLADEEIVAYLRGAYDLPDGVISLCFQVA